MKDQIDILLATYQGGSYLKEQLESIMQQSYRYFHLFIRDDGSTDETLSIIDSFKQSYPERISLIPSTHRLGVKGNFSELMKHAKSEYIMLCDQDDYWLEHKISCSLQKMKTLEQQYDPQQPLLIHTNLIVADEKLKILNPSFWEYSKLKPHNGNTLNRLLAHNIVTGCTILMNRALLRLALPIPQEAIMHDWWLGLIACTFGHIDFLEESTILYRQHSKNDIGAKNWKKIATSLIYAKKTLQLKGREELRNRLLKTIQQASQLLERHEPLLEIQKKYLIQSYVALGKGNALQKRYLFIKNRYFKNTFTKNIGMFLFI